MAQTQTRLQSATARVEDTPHSSGPGRSLSRSLMDYRIVPPFQTLSAEECASCYLGDGQMICFDQWNVNRSERCHFWTKVLSPSMKFTISFFSSSSTTSNVPERSDLINLSPEMRMVWHRAMVTPRSCSTDKRDSSVVQPLR